MTKGFHRYSPNLNFTIIRRATILFVYRIWSQNLNQGFLVLSLCFSYSAIQHQVSWTPSGRQYSPQREQPQSTQSQWEMNRCGLLKRLRVRNQKPETSLGTNSQAKDKKIRAFILSLRWRHTLPHGQITAVRFSSLAVNQNLSPRRWSERSSEITQVPSKLRKQKRRGQWEIPTFSKQIMFSIF